MHIRISHIVTLELKKIINFKLPAKLIIVNKKN